LCVSDPKEAEGLLRGKSVDPREIAGILTRYSKEAKRLQVDLKHERERKLLSIRQRLESELADVLPIDADWGAIGSLIAKALPETFSVATVTSIDWRTLRGPLTVGGAQLTINLNPKIVNAVHSVVAQEIQGDLNVPQDEQVLLQLINQHADDRLLELTAAVQILSDKAIPRSERLTSAQKLKEFLFSLPKALAPTGINILTAYLEQKLGLK
jgi:hypothetical protein